MIRQATLNDIKGLTNLFEQYRAFYHKEANYDKAKAFLEDRISNNESKIYVALDNNELIGFVQLFPLFSSTRMARYWLLNDLFVNENYRGKGFSKALINAGKALCHNTNACGMYLETGKDNMIGNQLYPAAGFKKMDRVNFYEWNTL